MQRNANAVHPWSFTFDRSFARGCGKGKDFRRYAVQVHERPLSVAVPCVSLSLERASRSCAGPAAPDNNKRYAPVEPVVALPKDLSLRLMRAGTPVVAFQAAVAARHGVASLVPEHQDCLLSALSVAIVSAGDAAELELGLALASRLASLTPARSVHPTERICGLGGGIRSRCEILYKLRPRPAHH